MLNRSTDIGFSKGLHTDAIGVEGALLEAQDVVITKQGELRKRGGKPAITTYSTGSGSAHRVHSAMATASAGVLVSFRDDSSVDRLSARVPGGSFVVLPTRADSSGSVPSHFAYSSFGGMFAHNGEIITSSGSLGNMAPARWGGSVKARYATGTISTTSGSTTITGSGTAWQANAEAGMYLHINSGSLADRTFVIKRVVSDTSLIVDQAPDATVAGVGYAVLPVGAVTSPSGIFGAWSGEHPMAQVACSHQGRMFVGNTYETGELYQRERIRWSATPNEASGKFIGCDYWHANGYTDVGVGQGGEITGLASFGGSLVVFKETAIYTLRGTVATDGSDLGASVDLISAAHGCLHARGFSVTKMGIVFCDARGVFVFDGSGVRSMTHGRIQRIWEQRMANETVVSQVGDRIIFTDQGNARIFVYNIVTDTWTTQSSQYYTHVLQTHAADGSLEYEMGFREGADSVDDWAGDFSDSDSQDAGLSTAPDMQVVTHPINLSDPVGNARATHVNVSGFATSAALAVSLIPGKYSRVPGTYGGTEHAVGTLPASTTDTSHRLRVPPGAGLMQSASVKLAASATMTDARIYAVSVLSAPSGRVDP